MTSTQTKAAHLTMPTPNGRFTLIHRDDGTVLASGWTDDPDYLMALIHPALRADGLKKSTGEQRKRLRAAVQAYYDGEPAVLGGVAVAQSGGPFLEQAWQVMRSIGPGDTRTYTEVAELAGNGQAVRAAGAACSRNAAVLFVPCHRILNARGKIGGFRYGVERKRWLLDHEAR
ncbi:MAG: methylated-DNA--[protein]-cysteine S-methyltransferase [Gordonia sp. (in: high G+C Gram-positive bacteria)]|uniref:methylated-DNA--[protein]-cysteine S-methyltransferase n=1 Tax=Gordonia sp. (in: high G+C Gram-positive bacteria) TaxID=84139 RepID=UPI0039E6669D